MIKKLMFDGESHDCLVVVADNGEYVCYRKDKSFVKFPADCDLAAEIKKHNQANADKPIPAAVVEERDAKLAEFFGE